MDEARESFCQLEKTVPHDVRLSYVVQIPEGYAEDDSRWPLILFLHGAGQRGTDPARLREEAAPPVIAAEMAGFPFVVVSPLCPEDDWWEPFDIVALLDEVLERYRIDPSRVYLTGLSMGGYGAWETAMRYPDRFAAIAPVCGGGRPLLAARIRHIPAWVFHGAKDPVVPLSESERMVEALRRLGGSVRFTVYPDAEHDSWTATYNNRDLYRWFLEHRLEGAETEDEDDAD